MYTSNQLINKTLLYTNEITDLSLLTCYYKDKNNNIVNIEGDFIDAGDNKYISPTFSIPLAGEYIFTITYNLETPINFYSALIIEPNKVGFLEDISSFTFNTKYKIIVNYPYSQHPKCRLMDFNGNIYLDNLPVNNIKDTDIWFVNCNIGKEGTKVNGNEWIIGDYILYLYSDETDITFNKSIKLDPTLNTAILKEINDYIKRTYINTGKLITRGV